MVSVNESPTRAAPQQHACTTCMHHCHTSGRFSASHSSPSDILRAEIERSLSGISLNEAVRFDQSDPAQLSLDRVAQHMSEFLKSVNLSSDKSLIPFCTNCDEDQAHKATNWCEKCELYLCDGCTRKIHSNKAFQSHTTILSTERLMLFCHQHSKRILKYWCKRCEVLVCDHCIADNHKCHLYSSLTDAAMEARTKFQETTQEIDQIRRNLNTFSETTNGLLSQQREVLRQGKRDIEQTFNNLQCLLEERKLAMIKQLKDDTSQTTAILDRQKNIIQQLLNLAIVNQHCIEKMLDSNDPIQMLKLKSTLHQIYDHFVEEYNQIDDGYVIKRYLFKKDEKDLEKISGMISKVGHLNSTSWMVQGASVTVQTTWLDISRVVGNSGFMTRENYCAYGYKLALKKPLKLLSFQIHSDHLGPIIGFVVNDIGTIIQKNTTYSTNSTMKWISVLIGCDIQNNYSVFVLAASENGSLTCKNGDHQARVINQNCSVESKYIHSLPQISDNSKVKVEDHPVSLDMVLRIEE